MSPSIAAAPHLELAEIQGNILHGYGLPLARHYFFRVDEPARGRQFVAAITEKVTTAERQTHPELPACTVNLGLTFAGLRALGLPAQALDGFPPDFREGMRARAGRLGDWGDNAPERWESMWETGRVHLWVAINAKEAHALKEGDSWLQRCVTQAGGVTQTGTQDAALLVIDGNRVRKEHFGFTDGLANPPIAGVRSGKDATSLRGTGKRLPNGEWVPIATGEFLLGHLNEEGELAPTPRPARLFRNGTFAVYRKLHQKVATFRKFLKEEGAKYPGGPELLAAKLVGRWRDGTPLALSPQQLNAHPVLHKAQRKSRDTEFGFDDDPDGLRCPLGSHIRRANPRDALAFGSGLAFDPATSSKLVARRRILRRGLPYGDWTPEDEPGDDEAEHGVIFIALNASLVNQFEFVQEQWMNYGGDFRQGNDPDPLVGSHGDNDKVVIPGDPSACAGNRPHICFRLPSFVVTRGGDYFFLPSLSALRWIGGAGV